MTTRCGTSVAFSTTDGEGRGRRSVSTLVKLLLVYEEVVVKALRFGALLVAGLSLALPAPAAFRYVDVGPRAPTLALVDVLGRSVNLPAARPALIDDGRRGR